MTANEFAEAIRSYGSAYARTARYCEDSDELDDAEDWELHTRHVLTAEFDRMTAELSRMRQVYDAAMAYVRSVDGPAVVDATTFASVLGSNRVLKEARGECHEALLRAGRDALKAEEN